MTAKWKISILFIMTLLFFTASPVFSLTENEAKELVRYVDEAIYPIECKSMAIMKHTTENNRQTEHKMEVLRKDNKLLAIFLTPPIQKGQKFLRNGDDMWTFLPKSKRVMRISAKERSMGGEANNNDILRVDLVKDYTVKYLGDETINNTSCYKLELLGKDRRVAYHKVLYWISKDRQPIKRELYSVSGKLMKNMYYEDIKNITGVMRPSKMIIENAVNTEFRTEMIWLEVDDSARFNDNIFTPDYLKNL